MNIIEFPQELLAARNKVKVSPQILFDAVRKKVVGQEEAIRVVVKSVFWHLNRHQYYQKHEKWLPKNCALLIGPSGSGKTLIIRETLKALNELLTVEKYKSLEVDCTELTAQGWSGTSIADVLSAHMETDLNNFSKSIVFLDEFDKICKPHTDKSGTDHNKMTQYNLLKLVEGTVYPVESKGYKERPPIDTNGLLVIFAGNFSEVRHARLPTSKPLGFMAEAEVPEELHLHKQLDNVGVATQLVGRITYIGELTELSEDDYRSILTDLLIPEMNSALETMGKKVSLSEEKIAEIVKVAKEVGTGARGLASQLTDAIDEELMSAEIEVEI